MSQPFRLIKGLTILGVKGKKNEIEQIEIGKWQNICTLTISQKFTIFTKKDMTANMLYSKIASLPSSMIEEVNDFVEFLKMKHQNKEIIKERGFGCAKGLMVMHDDFDASLEDFKEYM